MYSPVVVTLTRMSEVKASHGWSLSREPTATVSAVVMRTRARVAPDMASTRPSTYSCLVSAWRSACR